MRISDWSSDVCSSDLRGHPQNQRRRAGEPTSLFACRPWVGLRSGDAGDGRVEPRRIESRGACQHRLVRQAIGSPRPWNRSEEHTSELQSLMRISYAVFCLNKKTTKTPPKQHNTTTHSHHNQ